MTSAREHTYPYSVEVREALGTARAFQWVIRKHEKIYQRSDRKHASEVKAREQGLSAIEKLHISREV